jgi:type II secretory pathway component GspD/PulD (secretin)
MKRREPAHRNSARRGKTSLVAALILLSAGLSLAQAQKPAPQPKEAARQAEKAAARGDQAAAEGKTEEALADYAEAVRLAPGNLAIRRKQATLRAQAVQKLVDRAEAAALDGDIRRATEWMREALAVDPGATIVAERLAEMKQMQPEVLPRGDPRDYQLRGLPVLSPQPGRKSLNVRGDSKSAYEEVGRTFGIKVTFDPDLASRNVRLRVDNVDFYTAMRLLGAESRTFYRVVNSTLIFVAADSLEKRKEYEQEVEQTFRLDAAVAPEEMTEMVRVVREITNITRIALDAKNRSLSVRDTADKVRLASQLIKDLEQARRDVMLEIELLEVDRTAARNLGVSPSTSVQAIPLNSSEVAKLEQATDLTNLLTILSQVFTSRGISASTNNVYPVGGGKSTYLLTMPGGTATLSQALSTVKSGREILMRAQDGKPATFFVGQRFPVTLSLLSTSLGSTTVGGAVTPTTFPRTDFTVGANPVAVAAEDFTNDTQRDLAVANQADHSLSILINQGNGNFTAAAGSPFTLGANEQGPSAIAAGTFRVTDATHLVQPADLVVANAGSNTVSVLLGSQAFDGTFAEAAGSPFSVGAEPSAVVVADFDGDGFLDFAVANQGDNSISVFKGDGQGGFAQFPRSPFLLPGSEKGPVAMALGTFDSSGKPQIAVLNPATLNVGIFQASFDNTFDGTFTELSGSPVSTGIDPVAFAAGDLNADGFSDLAIVNQSANAITVLLNDGTSLFSPAAGSPLPTASTPAGVAIADFTNDGLGDIAVTNNQSSTVGVYGGLGSGTFSQNIELSVPAGPAALLTTDLNADGLPDVAVTAHSGSNNFVSVLLDATSFASGGTTQFPYPGSEYIDLGLKVKATPVVHDNREVTLQLEFEIRALAGNSINGIPVIANRTVSQTVRLREDETSVIAGLLDREETRSLAGIPGFAEIPAFGYALGTRNKSSSDTELLILVTPRRMSERLREAKAKYAGPSAGPGVGAAPVPAAEP